MKATRGTHLREPASAVMRSEGYLHEVDLTCYGWCMQLPTSWILVHHQSPLRRKRVCRFFTAFLIALLLFGQAQARDVTPCEALDARHSQIIDVVGTVALPMNSSTSEAWTWFYVTASGCTIRVFYDGLAPTWMHVGSQVRVRGERTSYNGEPEIIAQSISQGIIASSTPLTGTNPAGRGRFLVPFAISAGAVLVGLLLALVAVRQRRKADARESQVRKEGTRLAESMSADEILKIHQLVVASNERFESHMTADCYFRDSVYQTWRTDASAIEDWQVLASGSPVIPEDSELVMQGWQQRVVDARHEIDERNASFVDQRRAKDSEYLKSLYKYELTPHQQEAILHDEDSVLVVAGAGTGKTDTLVAKVAYLVEREGVAPSDVVVLTFLRKVRAELRERLGEALRAASEDMLVKTFHAHARSVLMNKRGHGDPPIDVTPLMSETSKAKLSEFVQESLDRILERGGEPVRFLVENLPSPVYMDSAQSATEYWEAWRTARRRSLSGDYVKSREELLIADYLFMMGIEFVYEERYPHVELDTEHRWYRPDFHIPSHDVWIEHFGLDRDHRPPPFFDREEASRYIDKYRWAMRQHSEHGTRLICTYSFEARDGVLFDKLRRALEESGVELQPRTDKEILALDSVKPRLSELSNLIASFLELYKEGHWTEGSFVERAAGAGQRARAQAFLSIFREVQEDYRLHLEEGGYVDYTDMLDNAATLISSDNEVHVPRYVLVDEFQDVSPSQVRYLQALASCVPRPRLFCIGDDWQSIYRFRGGDLSFMTEFERSLGFTKRISLTETFRFGERLEAVTSRFVMENPRQSRKNLKCTHKEDSPSVRVVFAENGIEGRPDYRSAVRKVVGMIEEESGPGSFASRVVLGRYGREKALPELSGVGISYSTIHSAKGLQWDYVLIAGLTSNAATYSFPSSFTDDPLIDLLRVSPELHAFSEERRVFYVAMTKARHAVYLLAPKVGESSFLRELRAGSYDIAWPEDADYAKALVCHECKTGTVRRRPGTEGRSDWWECDLCGARPCGRHARMFLCPACRRGGVRLLRTRYSPHAEPCQVCGYLPEE